MTRRIDEQALFRRIEDIADALAFYNGLQQASLVVRLGRDAPPVGRGDRSFEPYGLGERAA
jgi:hypothetical protein